MKPFLRRLAVCAWIIWACISVTLIATLSYSSFINDTHVYSHQSYSDAPFATNTLIDAYRGNKLSPADKETFLAAVSTGTLNVPPDEQISVPKNFSERWEAVGGALAGIGVFAAPLAMLQYLALGNPNPIRLFKSKGLGGQPGKVGA